MDKEKIEEIKEYVKERNEAFAGTLDEFIAFGIKHGTKFTTRETAEIGYHQCRTAASLPQEIKESSHKWLIDRGYESWLE